MQRASKGWSGKKTAGAGIVTALATGALLVSNKSAREKLMQHLAKLKYGLAGKLEEPQRENAQTPSLVQTAAVPRHHLETSLNDKIKNCEAEIAATNSLDELMSLALFSQKGKFVPMRKIASIEDQRKVILQCLLKFNLDDIPALAKGGVLDYVGPESSPSFLFVYPERKELLDKLIGENRTTIYNLKAGLHEEAQHPYALSRCWNQGYDCQALKVAGEADARVIIAAVHQKRDHILQLMQQPE